MEKRAVNITSDSASRDNLSATILNRKDRFIDPDRVTTEWEVFLERAVQSAFYTRRAFRWGKAQEILQD